MNVHVTSLGSYLRFSTLPFLEKQRTKPLSKALSVATVHISSPKWLGNIVSGFCFNSSEVTSILPCTWLLKVHWTYFWTIIITRLEQPGINWNDCWSTAETTRGGSLFNDTSEKDDMFLDCRAGWRVCWITAEDLLRRPKRNSQINFTSFILIYDSNSLQFYIVINYQRRNA